MVFTEGKRVKKHKLIRIVIMLLLISSGCLMILDEQSEGIMKRISDNGMRQEAVNRKGNGIDFADLQKINGDIVAWIKVPGTKVDYPVVKARDNSFYLSHGIDGSYSQYGAVFMDQRMYNRKLNETDNVIIYGHNMGHWDDSMFGTLMNYKSSEFSFSNDRIYLYTKDEKSEYRIISVMRTTSADKWYEFISLDKKSRYEDKLRYLETNSIHRFLNDKVNNPGKGQFITLSTCDYDGRYKMLIVGIKSNQ